VTEIAGTPSIGAEAGFTLLELLVVLVILGLMTALLVGGFAGQHGSLKLRATADALAAGLREARSEAVAENRPVEIDFDTDARNWRDASGNPQPLPAGIGIEFTAGLAGTAEPRRPHIRFEPDGSSTGGRIALASGGASESIEVSWLTGRVKLGDAR
jgi:general secretion pathway protein H